MTTRHRGDATPGVLAAAELGLLAVGLATVLGFSRLFLGTRYLGPLALAVTASWALALITRRLGWGVGRSALVSTVSALLVLTWTFAAHTTWAGLPTPTTADSVLTDVQRAFRGFSRMVAPVPATTGFLVLLAIVMWAFTFFADTAAFRFRGPVQAVIPYASAFIATGVLARDSGRVGAAMAFLSGLAIYAVTQRALRASERRWIPGQARSGTTAVAAGAAVAVAVAVVVGVVAGPLLPGDTEAVLDLRAVGRGGGPRTVVSPFVGVGSLLGPQSDTVMFEVTSTEPAYWRLTALARYDTDRNIWTSRGSYQEVDGSELAAAGPAAGSVDQAYRIEGLGGPWVPAAFEPVAIDIDAEVSFDARTSSVITRGDSLPTGTRYRVESASERLDPEDLNAAHTPDRVGAEYLDDAGVSPLVARIAREQVQGATSPYDRMMLLQQYFRDHFEYDTSVDYRDDVDPVAAFLDRRRGFCQQFASTFALMARSLGVPSRVAVGFTQGDAVGAVDDVTPGDGSDGSAAPATRYVVRGRHAHTWPEVYFDGVGWVAFEPTTGRGNPQAQSYTGIEPQQAEAPPAQAATTAPATTTTLPIPGSTAVPGDQLDTVAPDAPGPGSAAGRPAWPFWVLAAGGVLAAAVLVGRVARRRRRFAGLASDPRGGRVAVAWARAVEDLAAAGVAPGAAETPTELARRVRDSDVFGALDELDRPLGRPGDDGADRDRPDRPDNPDRAAVDAAVDTLARIETARRYGPTPPDDDDALAAEQAASVLHRAVWSMLGRRDRVRQLVGSTGRS